MFKIMKHPEQFSLFYIYWQILLPKMQFISTPKYFLLCVLWIRIPIVENECKIQSFYLRFAKIKFDNDPVSLTLTTYGAADFTV